MGKLVTTNNLSYLLLLPIQFNEPMNFHFVDLSTLETKVSNKMSLIAKHPAYMTFNMLMKELFELCTKSILSIIETLIFIYYKSMCKH